MLLGCGAPTLASAGLVDAMRMARPSVERREDWASTIAGYGGVRASGDGLDQLDSWGLATTRTFLRPSPTDVFTPA